MGAFTPFLPKMPLTTAERWPRLVRFPELLATVEMLQGICELHDEVLARLLRGEDPAVLREEYLDAPGEAEGENIHRTGTRPPSAS